MKKAIGAITPLIALFLILAMAFPVSASWNSDLSGGTTVTVADKDPFTVDTFLGVPSYYSSNTSKYTPSELIVRFYKDAYGGLDVSTSGSPVITTTGYEFKIPETPQQGDVVYGAGGHWAIVKSFNKSKGALVIFEQGNVTDGKAYINRTLKYPSDSYTVFTPRAKTGYSTVVLKNTETGSKVLLNRGTVYDVDSVSTTAAPTTTAAQSSAADRGTTTRDTTARGTTTPASTDAAETETTTEYNFTTYVGENEAEVVDDSVYTTSAMPEGYEEFFTSRSTQTAEGAYDPNQDTQYYYTDTLPYGDENILETTEPQTEESKTINPTLVFGIAMIAGIVCITAAGVFAGLVIKKRSEDDE